MTANGLMAASACAALLLASADTAAAQASPWLSAGHWSRDVAIRMHALGATPRGFDPAARVHTAAATRAAFAGCGDSAAVGLACSERFDAERAAHARTWLELGGVYDVRDGGMLGGGFTAAREWTGPRALEDINAAGARLRAALLPVPRLALSASVVTGTDGTHVEHASAELRAGVFGLWGGRRIIGYAPGLEGGLVLSGAVPVDGGGVRIPEPVELAWLGAVTAELFVAAADSSGVVREPWLVGMRLHAQPHARFDIGATRAAVFGGIEGARVGFRQVAEVLVGANPRGDYADDQVASLDARWRPPLAALPLELYAEWAMHDIDLEVLVDVPAFTVGARLPALPGMESVGATLEHTQIAGACCGNPPWYHHFELADGWTESGELRAHALGGHGREWRGSLHAALADGRVLLRADAFRRKRGAENLFAPDRSGRAHGAALTLDAALSRHTAVTALIAHERGDGWRETGATLALRWHH